MNFSTAKLSFSALSANFRMILESAPRKNTPKKAAPNVSGGGLNYEL